MRVYGALLSLFQIGAAGRLFLLGFLKILALLMAFFFLDKERREPTHPAKSRHHFSRWLQLPIVISLLVACGAEGYDAYLKYTDDKESNAKTEQLLGSIERRSRPLFPMRIHSLYTLDLTGASFEPLRKVKSTFLDGDVVDEMRLKKVAPRVLDRQIADVFNTTVDTWLYFIKDPQHTLTLPRFIGDKSEKLIQLSISLETPTSCGADDKSLVKTACEWRGNLVSLPFDSPPIDQYSSGRTYVHGAIQFFPDLVNSALVVTYCLGLPDDSPHPQLVTELKKIVNLRSLGITIAGGDSFTLNNPVDHRFEANCSYSLFEFATTPEKLEAQLDPQ